MRVLRTRTTTRSAQRRRGSIFTAAVAALALVISACGASDSDAGAEAETVTDTNVESNVETPETDGADDAETDGTDTESDAATDDADESNDANGTDEVAPDTLEKLRVRHPVQLAFSAPFTLINADGPLGQYVNEIDIDQWATPDVLRGMLTSGQTDVTAVPTYVGANMYNKGVDVHMLAVVVWGLLHVIGPDGTESSWDSLRGETVMLPFKNDMPDLVFQYLVKANGLTIGEDFSVEYYAQPPEVVARLAAGQGAWAVLPEHTATLAINKAAQEGVELTRVLNLQEEWGAATGTQPRIPQAGIVVSQAFADDNPGLIGALLDELTRAVDEVNTASDEVTALLSETSDIPAPMIAKIIPQLNLDVVPADVARPELEAFYTELATLSPEIIGGGLPDDGFYLADPRQ